MWIPAHTSIPPNEKVDQLAKGGVIKEGIDLNINISKAEGQQPETVQHILITCRSYTRETDKMYTEIKEFCFTDISVKSIL